MRLRALASVASLVTSFVIAGCGAGSGAGRGANTPSGERAAAAGVAVTDDAFPQAVRDLLAAPPGSKERAQRLAGVEARQMLRAAARFKGHAPTRGMMTVIGGLEMVRLGELTPEMLGPGGREALRGAAKELSARGDEGRARAVFEIWSRVASDAEKAEIKAHLDALAMWMRDAVAHGGPVASAGALEQAAVARRLLEPTKAALDEATARTIDWIEKAFQLRAASEQRQHRAPPPTREELTEALRALQTGGSVLATIYLRDADARGAVATIDKAQVRDLVRPELMATLEATSDHPDATHWLEVLHALRPSREGRDDEDVGDDEDLLRVASFAVAREAYRLDPTQVEAAGAVAASLQDYGMADATPAVLVDAVRAHPDPRIVGAALAITMRAMASEIDAEEPDGARRAFKAAGPILTMADDRAFEGKLQPSPAKVRALMGEIELREGRLDDARALLGASLKTEKSGTVLLELARIDRHDGKIDAALGELREALAAPDAQRDPALRGEVLLETSDLTREKGDVGKARTPLTEALKALTKARNTPDADDRARVERVLARVLDRFGATKPADRALERAFEAAPRDKHQAAATIGQVIGRAFVRGDLKGAREGLQRGIAADLDDDDLVYYALWVRLLERQLHQPTDGTPERVFQRSIDDARWVGKLAQFGAGLLKAQDLVAAASTPAQKTEAMFYAAMDRRASGDAKGAEEELRKVLAGGGVDLMEVALTRELLSGPRAQIGGPLPPEANAP